MSINNSHNAAAVLSHQSLFEQLRPHAAKWNEIGTFLGFHQNELRVIEGRPKNFMGAPVSCLSEMLDAWLEWEPGDNRGSVSLESLKKAVKKAGLGRTAAELH